MLDAISGGRLDVGARAFLPRGFRRFDRSPDESVARYRRGSSRSIFCSREKMRIAAAAIENTTSRTRPASSRVRGFAIAALSTPDLSNAGRMGYSVMAIAFVAARCGRCSAA